MYRTVAVFIFVLLVFSCYAPDTATDAYLMRAVYGGEQELWSFFYQTADIAPSIGVVIATGGSFEKWIDEARLPIWVETQFDDMVLFILNEDGIVVVAGRHRISYP